MKLFFIALTTFLSVVLTLLFAQWYSFHCPNWLLMESGHLSATYFAVFAITMFFEIFTGICVFHFQNLKNEKLRDNQVSKHI